MDKSIIKAEDKKESKVVDKKKEQKKRIVSKIRRIIAIAFWIYVPIKAFIYDFDTAILTCFAPSYLWIVEFRLFWFLLIVSVCWIYMGGREFVKTILYIFSYPVTFFLGEIVRGIIKYFDIVLKFFGGDFFNLILFVGNYFIGIKKHLSFRVFLLLLMVSSIVFIFRTDNMIVQYIAICYLLFYLLIHYFLKVKAIFSPTTLFSSLDNLIIKLKSNLNRKSDSEEKKVKNLYDNAKLDFLVFWYFLLGFVRKKVKDFTHSPKIVLYYVLSLCYSIFLTVLIFNAIYFSVFKLYPHSFEFEGNCSFVSFTILSINSLISMEPNIIKPVALFPSILITIEGLTGWMLSIIYITILFIIIIKHYNATVERIVSNIEFELKTIEGYMQTKHELSLSEAIEKLRENENNSITAIDYFNEKIREDEEDS